MFTVLNIPMKGYEQTNMAALDQTETHLCCFSASHTQSKSNDFYLVTGSFDFDPVSWPHHIVLSLYKTLY